jgi:hypothetical protein
VALSINATSGALNNLEFHAFHCEILFISIQKPDICENNARKQ